MKKKSKRFLLIGGAVIVVVIIIINALSSGRDATSVFAEKVTISDLTEEVSASGYIQPVTKVNITSQVTAEIISIPVKEGETVKRGQLLVQLDTVQLQKDLDQYQYSLDEMLARTEAYKSLYKQSEEDYERQKQLFERELISESVLDNTEYTFQNYKYTYEAIKNQTKQARARFEKAEDNLKKTKIVAPMSGVITYLDAEVGEIAAAQTPYSQGRTLMIISNLSTYEVEVDVDETEIIKIELGQEAKIEIDAFVDTTFNGEVVEIGNTAVVSSMNTNERATNFKVKVLFKDKSPNIRPGMSATVDIVTNKKENVLTVPYGAVVMRELDADSIDAARGGTFINSNDESEDKDANENDSVDAGKGETENDTTSSDNGKKNLKEFKGLFLVNEQKAEFVIVETGIADQKNIEITTGITKEDTVITGPYRTLRKIKHGDDIELQEIKKSENE
jgi:HlyD family secretion protein